MFRQRTVSPAIVAGYALLLEVDAHLNEIAGRDVVDMMLPAKAILSFRLIVIGDHFRSKVVPLAREMRLLFVVEIFDRIT